MKKSLLLFLLISCSVVRFPSPVVETTPVNGDADDCAFWIDKQNVYRSVLIGNDKQANGALYVWDNQGKFVAKTQPINRPVGVDVRYGMTLKKGAVDIAVCGVRSTNQLKIFQIDKTTRRLIDLTSEQGISTYHEKDTYGIALYKNPADGKIYAFVSAKYKTNIHQIYLFENKKGKIEGKLIRAFGKNDQKSFVEGMVADDELGYLYCSDERQAVLKYYADPLQQNNHFINTFAQGDGIKGDREGIALYKSDEKTGFLILSSQGNSTFKIYEREANNAFVKTVSPAGIRHTDGVAATHISISKNCSQGTIACHNGLGKNFVLYSWLEFFQDKK